MSSTSDVSIADLIVARTTAFAFALENFAQYTDVPYLADALTADSVAENPALLANTIAVVSADGEANINAIIARFGSGTVNELRGLLGIPTTAGINHADAQWRTTITKTRTSILGKLTVLGISPENIAKVSEVDSQNLFLTPAQIIAKIESLDVFAGRTEIIAGEPYVLIG